MSRMLGAFAIGVALVLSGPASSGLADPDPGPGGRVVVTPSDPGGKYGPPAVDVGVGTPGQEAAAAGRGARGSAGGGGCSYSAAPDLERWSRGLPGRLVPGGRDQVGPTSRLYAEVCPGRPVSYVWLGAAQVPGATPPTPEKLAQQAYAQLRLPLPTPEHSPDLLLADGRAAVLVGEHTWVWTDRSRFRSQSRRLRVGPVWAEVTATPVGLSFDPGNGDPILSCRGPGTAFVPGRSGPHAPSPTCDYLYSRSSADAPGGVVTVEYGIRWQVRWTGSTGAAPAGGQLPDMTSRAATSFAVAEAQAVGTSGS